MGLLIDDGKGRGNSASVDDANRIETFAITISSDQHATEDGDSYNLNSGLVTLSSSAESGVLYVKNNEERDLKVSGVVTIFGPSTGGSATDTTQVRIYKNVTTGTLVSNSTTADINSNRNFSSSKTLTIDNFKGATGSTITDGSVHIESLVSPGNRVFFAIDEVLGTGDTIAISYEPPDSNTSMKTEAAIICHLKDKERV